MKGGTIQSMYSQFKNTTRNGEICPIRGETTCLRFLYFSHTSYAAY